MAEKMSITYASQNDGFDEQKRNFSFESVFNEYNEWMNAKKKHNR